MGWVCFGAAEWDGKRMPAKRGDMGSFNYCEDIVR
jgi:hypothetical protein